MILMPGSRKMSPTDTESKYNFILYNTLLNSDHLIGCLWSRDIE
jgi:hypothetical protein